MDDGPPDERFAGRIFLDMEKSEREISLTEAPPFEEPEEPPTSDRRKPEMSSSSRCSTPRKRNDDVVIL